MKVMYVGPKFYDGKPEMGLGYEHYNLYGTLAEMKGVEALYFPLDEVMAKHGREQMNRMLLDEVHSKKPDICFFFIIRDEISKETIKEISSSGKTTTVNWFGDDYGRFDSFSRHYAPLFNWSATTDQDSVEKYHKIGYHNIIKTQWACNDRIYRPVPRRGKTQKYKHDLSFVGQCYSNREEIVRELNGAGIKTVAFGRGWPKGRISQKGMLEAFSLSKVSLNITESPRRIEPRFIAGIFLTREIDKSITVNSPTEWSGIVASLLYKPKPHIKARTFEIPACGGFMLTQYVKGLEEYYDEGKEIAIFRDNKELIDKATYYLENGKERERAANAAYKRTIREDTYTKRFEAIFKSMGFSP